MQGEKSSFNAGKVRTCIACYANNADAQRDEREYRSRLSAEWIDSCLAAIQQTAEK